ncbi:MAG: 2-hydroxychromene-2-carboxylate isomerase [Azospirillaceae bacterium]
MSRTIEYFHSLSSPWAFLGGRQLHEIAARHGATIVPRPILVQTENGGILLRTRPQARQDYHALELDRWRKFLDLPLKLQPKFYPTDPTGACLMVIAAKQAGLDAVGLSHALLTALWADDRDTKDPDVRQAIAEEIGLDGAALLAAAETEAVDAEWRKNKADAIALGIFGTPSYVLDGEIFWGQDRLPFLDRALAAV